MNKVAQGCLLYDISGRHRVPFSKLLCFHVL